LRYNPYGEDDAALEIGEGEGLDAVEDLHDDDVSEQDDAADKDTPGSNYGEVPLSGDEPDGEDNTENTDSDTSSIAKDDAASDSDSVVDVYDDAQASENDGFSPVYVSDDDQSVDGDAVVSASGDGEDSTSSSSDDHPDIDKDVAFDEADSSDNDGNSANSTNDNDQDSDDGQDSDDAYQYDDTVAGAYEYDAGPFDGQYASYDDEEGTRTPSNSQGC
jgi:hypothetical protein